MKRNNQINKELQRINNVAKGIKSSRRVSNSVMQGGVNCEEGHINQFSDLEELELNIEVTESEILGQYTEWNEGGTTTLYLQGEWHLDLLRVGELC